MDLTSFPLVAPGPEGAAVQRIIQSRLTLEAEGEEIRRSAVWFSSLNFLHRVFDHFPLGSLVVDGFENREADRGTRSRSRSVETDYVYYTLAVNVLARGEEGFADLGQRWNEFGERAPLRTLPFEGLSAAMKTLLEDDFRSKEFRPLRDAFSNFVHQRAVTSIERRLGCPHDLPGKQTAAILGCSLAGVRQLLKSRGLTGNVGRVDRKGASKVSVQTGSLFRALRRRMAAITLPKAAELTGIPKRTLLELYGAGILPAEYGPLTDGRTNIGVHPAVVTALLRAWPEASKKTRSESWANELAIRLQAAQRGRSEEDDTRAFEESLPSPPLESGAVGASEGIQAGVPLAQAAIRLGVTMDVVRVLEQAALLSVEKGTVYGLDRFLTDYLWDLDAAIALRKSLKSLELWVRRGRITPALAIGVRRLFRRSDIERVSSDACTVPQAALMLGCDEQKVRSLLARHELQPISGPLVDEGKEHLVSRSEVRRMASEQHNDSGKH